jgi:hypothetical protein
MKKKRVKKLRPNEQYAADLRKHVEDQAAKDGTVLDSVFLDIWQRGVAHIFSPKNIAREIIGVAPVKPPTELMKRLRERYGR